MATNINKAIKISQKHLLGIQDLKVPEIKFILNEAQQFIELNRSKNKKLDLLKGKTQINLFFEPSTRTQSSFELAGKRLGADVMSMNITNSAIKKGETLIDTAMTLNAMHPDIIVIRHQDSGACNLLSQKVNCAVLNAGDGRREHPTQALLDALTIINRKKNIEGLKIAICGDILHSRVARSNVYLLTMLGAEVNIIGPSNLLPKDSTIEIIDTSGSNIIQIAANTKVIKTLWTKNAARLTFEDDRVITINGADKFTFNMGGNVTDGTDGTDLTFAEFALSFGIDDVLNLSGSNTGRS